MLYRFDLAVRVCDHATPMRPRVQAIAIPSEIGDFSEDIRSIYGELGRTYGSDSLTGECPPPVDVFETDDSVEITVDLPGVDAGGVRVRAKADSVLIAGEKVPRRARAESSFHLVERGYGRFARVVRIGRPCDTSRAQATLAHGELRISIPKLTERRGRAVEIVVRTRTDG
jgi:HSP20 family protein